MLIAAGIPVAHRRVLLQKLSGPEQQIVKIHCVAGQQQLLVALVNSGDDLVAVGLDGEIVHLEQFVFRSRDRPMD